MNGLTRRAALRAVAALTVTLVGRRRALAAPPDAACPPDKLTDFLAQVARARAGVTTLTGPFTQERSIGLLAAKVRSTGTLTLVRPDRLRWELAPPDEAIYWVTPDGLAYRSPTGQGKVPAASQKATAALADLRILLGGDLNELRGRYDLRGSCPEHAPFVLHATPKPGVEAPFQDMTFTLAPDLIAPETVTITEGPRDRTEIRFGTLRVNAPVPPSAMTP